MHQRYAEPAYDGLVALATAVAFIAYMLGLFFDPTSSVIISLMLVVLGGIALIPRERRIVAGIIGSLAVVIGGVAVPRVIVDFTGIDNELPLTIALSGLVLLLSFAALRVTTFNLKSTRPA